MKAIVFDYNGVLVDDLDVHKESYFVLAKRIGSTATREDILSILGTTPTMSKIELIAGTKDHAVTKPLLQEKTELYLELAKKKGILFAGVRELLPRLAKSHKLAMITSTTRQQLERAFPPELLSLFETILTYEDVQKPKPDPSSLILALERLDVQKSDACYVGDTDSDMRFATSAGVYAIGIPTGHRTREQLEDAGSDRIINSITELEGIV